MKEPLLTIFLVWTARYALQAKTLFTPDYTVYYEISNIYLQNE